MGQKQEGILECLVSLPLMAISHCPAFTVSVQFRITRGSEGLSRRSHGVHVPVRDAVLSGASCLELSFENGYDSGPRWS